MKGALEGASYYGERAYNLICIPSGACIFGICVLAASSSCFLAFCDSSSFLVDLNKINKSDFHIALYLISTLYLGYSVSCVLIDSFNFGCCARTYPRRDFIASVVMWQAANRVLSRRRDRTLGKSWLNTFTTLLIPWVVCSETFFFVHDEWSEDCEHSNVEISVNYSIRTCCVHVTEPEKSPRGLKIYTWMRRSKWRETVDRTRIGGTDLVSSGICPSHKQLLAIFPAQLHIWPLDIWPSPRPFRELVEQAFLPQQLLLLPTVKHNSVEQHETKNILKYKRWKQVIGKLDKWNKRCVFAVLVFWKGGIGLKILALVFNHWDAKLIAPCTRDFSRVDLEQVTGHS